MSRRRRRRPSTQPAIDASDAQTVTCTFPAVAQGEYTLVVSCRNGNRASLAPAVGKIKVMVKAA